MGIFSRPRDSKRIDELGESLAKLKRDFQDLEMEWTNAYDKLRSMMQRIAKRAEVAEKAQEQSEQTTEPGATPISADPRSGRLLNARQAELQQQILRRRAGG